MVDDESYTEGLTDEEKEQLEALERGEFSGGADEPEREKAEEAAGWAEETASEETQDGQDEGEESEKEDSRRIPISEHIKERKRRQQAEEQLNRFNAVFEQLRQQQQQQQAPQEQEQPQPPDPNEQPFEYMQYQGQRIDELTQQQQQQIEAQRAERARQQFEAQLREHEQQFAQQYEDYYDRVQHVGRQIVTDYKYRLTPQFLQQGLDLESAKQAAEQQAAQIASQDMKAMAYDAAQRGISPAQYFYEMAAERGYQPQQKPVEQQASRQEAPAQKRQAGRKAFKSLSQAEGAPPSELNIQDLLKMSDTDMLEYMDKKGIKVEDIDKLLQRGG